MAGTLRRVTFRHVYKSRSDIKLYFYIDIRFKSYYSAYMKWVTVILLVVLAFTVLAPLSPFSLVIDRQEQPLLGNLDVCNAAAPALSSNGEMPCVNTIPSKLPLYLSITTSDSFHPLFTEVVLTAPNEHPPKA